MSTLLKYQIKSVIEWNTDNRKCSSKLIMDEPTGFYFSINIWNNGLSPVLEHQPLWSWLELYNSISRQELIIGLKKLEKTLSRSKLRCFNRFNRLLDGSIGKWIDRQVDEQIDRRCGIYAYSCNTRQRQKITLSDACKYRHFQGKNKTHTNAGACTHTHAKERWCTRTYTHTHDVRSETHIWEFETDGENMLI